MTTLVVMAQEVSGREGDHPETDDDGADGEDPVAGLAILGRKGGGFANAEDLAGKADGHEKGAEDEGDPSHGLTFLPQLMWMRKEGSADFGECGLGLQDNKMAGDREGMANETDTRWSSGDGADVIGIPGRDGRGFIGWRRKPGAEE